MKNFLIKLAYISILAFIVQYIFGNWLIERRNELVKEIYFPIKRWEDFYSQPKNSIDLIFLGSSHCYRSFIPQIFDSTLNMNSFNLGSSQQSISTSYFILKEALISQKPKYVVLETHHGTASTNNNYASILHNFQQMKPNEPKYNMLKTVSFPQAISLALFPIKSVTPNRDQLLKGKKLYPDTTANTYYSVYYNKGYVATFKNDKYKFQAQIKERTISTVHSSQMKYLKKIAEECKKNNIQLLLFTQPFHPQYAQSITNYDSVYYTFHEFAKTNDIPYYDMNKASPLPDSLFYDSGHLLHNGAILFSEETAQIIKEFIL